MFIRHEPQHLVLCFFFHMGQPFFLNGREGVSDNSQKNTENDNPKECKARRKDPSPHGGGDQITVPNRCKARDGKVHGIHHSPFLKHTRKGHHGHQNVQTHIIRTKTQRITRSFKRQLGKVTCQIGLVVIHHSHSITAVLAILFLLLLL